MDHALSVRVRQGFRRLNTDSCSLQNPALAHRGASLGELGFSQNGIQSATFDILHQVIVPALVLPDPENRHDICMMKPAGGSRLAAKSRQVTAAGQELDRHVAIQRTLDCFINNAHAPAADLADQA